MALKNSQYDELMRQYSFRQTKHARQLEERTQNAFKICPRLEDIRNEVASLSAAQARARILGHDEGLAAYRTQVAALAEERRQLLLSHALPADYLDPSYDCELCHDTGWLPGNTRCRCYKKAAVDLLYRDSGLLNVLAKENFDTFRLEYYPEDMTRQFGHKEISARSNMEVTLKLCKDYVAGFSQSKGNLLFTGMAGCGKTFMTHCIAKALMDDGYSVVYQTAEQFFQRFADEQFSRDREEAETIEASQFFYDSDLLIIDDLGSELSNAFTNSKLFQCINERLMRGVATIISTNISLTELRDVYSDRIYSRLIGNFKCLPFFGPDIRFTKAYQK